MIPWDDVRDESSLGSNPCQLWKTADALSHRSHPLVHVHVGLLPCSNPLWNVGGQLIGDQWRIISLSQLMKLALQS